MARAHCSSRLPLPAIHWCTLTETRQRLRLNALSRPRQTSSSKCLHACVLQTLVKRVPGRATGIGVSCVPSSRATASGSYYIHTIKGSPPQARPPRHITWCTSRRTPSLSPAHACHTRKVRGWPPRADHQHADLRLRAAGGSGGFAELEPLTCSNDSRILEEQHLPRAVGLRALRCLRRPRLQAPRVSQPCRMPAARRTGRCVDSRSRGHL